MRDQVLELARRIGRDPDEIVELWSERAAIREVDGGQSRAMAEREAFDEIRATLEPSVVDGERKGPRAAAAVTAVAKRADEES